MDYYAIVDTDNRVLDVFVSELDASAPLVQFEGDRRSAHHTEKGKTDVTHWMYLPEAPAESAESLQGKRK